MFAPRTLAEGVARQDFLGCHPDCEESQKCKGRTMEKLISRDVAPSLNPMTGHTTNVLGSGPASMRCSPLFTEWMPG